jgi:hypothetical protein
MLSPRVLKLKFRYGESRPCEVHLLSVMRASNRAPYLGYFAIFDGDPFGSGSTGNEWVFCEMEEFPY